MRALLKDRETGEVLLWTDGPQVCDAARCVDLEPGEDLGEVVGKWVRDTGGSWPDLQPFVAVPGVAWCAWGDDVALVWESGGSWHSSDGNAFQDWEDALAHELRAWAEGDGEPFPLDISPADILDGRDVVQP